MNTYFTSNATGQAYKIDMNDKVLKLVEGVWTETEVITADVLKANSAHYTTRPIIHHGKIQIGKDVIEANYYFISETLIEYRRSGLTFITDYKSVILE